MRNYSNKEGFNDPSKKSVDLNALKHSYFSSMDNVIVANVNPPLKEVIHEWVDRRVEQKLQEYSRLYNTPIKYYPYETKFSVDRNKVSELPPVIATKPWIPIDEEIENNNRIKKDIYTISSGHFKISWQKFSSTDKFACTHASITYLENDMEVITGYIRIDGSEIKFHESVKDLLLSSLHSFIIDNLSDFCRVLLRLKEEIPLRVLNYKRDFIRRNEIIRIPLGENCGMLYNRTKDIATFVDDWKRSDEKLQEVMEV